jgi:predicted DNA-binding protein (MmcQ/YjbR family)
VLSAGSNQTMIVKIKSYKRIGASRNLLEYAINDKKRLFDKNGRSFVITQNLKGQSIDEWVKEIKENETYRKHKRKNNIFLTQEIISFHREDSKNITLKKMEDMAREYMRLRNPAGIFVAAPHFDKSHWHIHIIAASLEYRTGKSLRMSRQEFSELKQNIQTYQVEKYPELAKSVVRHGRKKKARITDREYQYKLRTGKQTKREEVIALIKSCSLNTSSQEEFFARLKACKLQHYERGGRITGIVYDEKKYRFKRLGIDLAHVISTEKKRKRELGKSRNKKQARIIGRSER